MTQSLSFIVADRPPAMYRIEAVAIVVSRISMNVGTTTATATNQGLIAGRLTAFEARATLLMTRLLRDGREWQWIEDRWGSTRHPSRAAFAAGNGGHRLQGCPRG